MKARANNAWMGIFLSLFLAASSWGQVVINEILADNQTAVSVEDAYPDYVELFNPTLQPVNLGGWSLTDNFNLPRKFVFPANTMLAPGRYLMVWCDSQTNQPGLHAAFALSRAGEPVGLFDAIGFLRDSVLFGLQVTDLSSGRVPDGTGPWALTTPTPESANLAQPLGTTAALRFNEWMANAGTDPDWFEVYNRTNLPVALGGLVFSDRIAVPPTNRAVPALSFIAGNGFVQVIADDLNQTTADHVDFKLSSTSGEALALYAADRSTRIDSVTFGPQTLNVSQGCLPDGGTNIVFFRVNQATPGQGNFLAITNVLINELLTHADPPFEDAVELFNPTTQPVDISHWWLSNNRDDPKRYRVPQGTVIPAGGFKVFYEYQFDANDLGFTFNSYEPGEVVLCGGDAAGNLTGDRLQQSFGPAANGVSFGRFTTSRGADFVAGRQRTFGVDAPADLGEFRNGNGATNAYPLVGPVVINEVMYRPPDYLVGGLPVDNSDDEFIELLNPGSAPVPLYDPVYPTNRWRLRNAVSFDFPSNLVMAAQSTLLVLNFNPTNTAMLDAFRARFNVPSDVLVAGPYSGKLDNRGETLELLKPDAPQPPGRPHPGLVPYVLVDAVAYEDRAPWPVSPDGLGDSLQRRSAVVYGNDPVHWLGAAPTPGRLNAVESPVMESAARTFAGEFSFQFTALAGVAYAVEWLADLNGASPVSLTNIPAALESYTVQVRDPGIATNGPARYYRVRVVPVSTSGF